MTTAPRIGCAISTKTLTGVCCGCDEDAAVDSTADGVGVTAAGEGSVARTMEGFRPHETNAPRTRIKLKPTHRILPNHTVCWSPRSEEHTSELQSLRHLVCRLLLEKKKIQSQK